MKSRSIVAATLALVTGTPAAADWKPGNAGVERAAKDPRVAAALAAVDRLDRAVVADDHAAFAALLADDLVVNNPQNTLSAEGETARLNANGRISYTSYHRTIDYAGIRAGMVVLMGEELCVAKPPNPLAGQPVRRRFLDVWKQQGDRWLLTARQATIVPAAAPAR